MAFCISTSSEAWAHGLDESVETQKLVYDGDQIVGAFTNFGPLFPASNGTWAWAPDEIVDGVPLAWELPSGEVVLASTTEGVFVGEVPGCTMEAATGIDDGVVVVDFANGPGDLVYAAAESGSGAAGLLESENAGRDWVPTQIWGETLDLSAVETTALRAWAFGADGDDIVLWTRELPDGDWTSVPIAEVEKPAFVGADSNDAFLVEETDDGFFLFAFPPSGAARVWGPSRTSPVSADSWKEDIVAVDSFGSLLLIKANDIAPPRWTAACVASNAGVISLCLHRGTGYAWGSFDEEQQSWIPGQPWLDIVPAECAPGTRGAQKIDEFWDVAQAGGIATQKPPTDPLAEDGCCATARSRSLSPAIFALIGVVVLIRRRRTAKM